MTLARFEGILDCIESAMKPFGDNFSRVVFWNLNRTKGISRAEAMDQPEKFVACLREIFGSSSQLVEDHIMVELKNRFNLQGGDLKDCLRAIQAAKNHVLLVTA